MAIAENRSAEGEKVVADDRDYLIHSWSVQSALSPLAVAGAEGRYFWDYEGKRYLDFASQLVNVSIGHQHPKLVAAIKEQADTLCTIGPPMANDKRSEAGAPDRRGDAGRPQAHVLHERRRRGERERGQARPLGHRPPQDVARYRSYHGATAGAVTLTGDPRRWFAEPGIPGVVRMFDPYTYRCPAGHPDPVPRLLGRPAPRGDPHVRGRRTPSPPSSSRRSRDERDHRPARRLPAVDPRDVRPPRDPADLRRGDGRLGPHRPLVRLRALGRRPRHDHDREGDQLRLRAARRDDGARPRLRGDQGQVLRRRAHLFGPPARLRGRVASIEAFKEEGIVENSAADGRRPARGAAEARRAPPVDRRRPRTRTLLGPRARPQPRDPRAARAVQRGRRGGGADDADREGGDRARPLPVRRTGTWS